MKPLVIYIKENGKIELSREELDKMLEDAYQGGYLDGSKTSTITYPYYPYYTEKTVPNWWEKVTCSPNVGTTTTTTTTCKCGGEHHCTCHSEEE